MCDRDPVIFEAKSIRVNGFETEIGFESEHTKPGLDYDMVFAKVMSKWTVVQIS